MTEPLTDPYAIALKHISESILAGDMALLGVIKELIVKVTGLEARIEELELIASLAVHTPKETH